MRKILILAVLFMMLAAPVLARPHGSPDPSSGNSVPAAIDFAGDCEYLKGFSEVGCICSSEGGLGGYPGISDVAHLLHGPELPP